MELQVKGFNIQTAFVIDGESHCEEISRLKQQLLTLELALLKTRSIRSLRSTNLSSFEYLMFDLSIPATATTLFTLYVVAATIESPP